jgi:hypothetical protein
VDETLTRLVPELMFGARYTDLLLRFRDWEEKIQGGVRQAVAEIGCEIEQFITIPTLPELIYLKPFEVRAPGTFETRLHDVEAKLDVVATVQIPRLENIAALISTRSDIPTAMTEAIDRAVRAKMHSIHPERFYMRFSFTDEERHREEAQSVEAELGQLITGCLSGDPFHAQVLTIVLKIVETDLIRRFRELQEAIPSFTVSVDRADVEPMEFLGDLRVVAVHRDGWHTFRALTGGIEQITAGVCGQLQTFLQTCPAAELLFRDVAGHATLHRDVSEAVVPYAAEQFGLVVRISNFRRAVAPLELVYRNGRLREFEEVQGLSTRATVTEQRRILARIEELGERCKGLWAPEDADELRATEAEIAALQGRLHHAVWQAAAELGHASIGAPPPVLALEASSPGAAEAAEAGGTDES